MRSSLLVLCLAAGYSVYAQTSPDQLAINVDGKPFAIFHYGADANKPFLAPIRSASGKIITRGFPMENIPGESRDHLHHRGLWFSYDDVNGVKFWENDPSYAKTKPNIGRIVVHHAEVKEKKGSSKVVADMEWRDPNNKVLLVEDREMVFSDVGDVRTIDFQITLTASEADVAFRRYQGRGLRHPTDRRVFRKEGSQNRGCRWTDAHGQRVG